MMIRARRYIPMFAICSIGLFVGCVSQDSSDSAAMNAFEAKKISKGDDGSVALSIPQPEITNEFQADKDNAAVVDDWMLTIEPIKSRFMLGEPVVVRVKLENVSDQPLEVAPLLQPEYHQTTYTIARTDDGVPFHFNPIAQYLTLPITQMRTFQPGESVTEEVNLFASNAGWVFRWAGEYEITADFDAGTSASNRMGTNTTLINVVAGNAQDHAAADIMMNGEAALLMQFERGDHLVDGLANLNKVATEYPNTIHALYAQFVLGNNEAQSFFNGTERRPAHPAKAIPHLEVVRESLRAQNAPVVSKNIRLNTYKYLASSYSRLGRTDDARATLTEFVSLYGADPTMADAVNVIRTQLSEL